MLVFNEWQTRCDTVWPNADDVLRVNQLKILLMELFQVEHVGELHPHMIQPVLSRFTSWVPPHAEEDDF